MLENINTDILIKIILNTFSSLSNNNSSDYYSSDSDSYNYDSYNDDDYSSFDDYSSSDNNSPINNNNTSNKSSSNKSSSNDNNNLLKLQYVSKCFYNIIHNNKDIYYKIIDKYYYSFNLHRIIPYRPICNNKLIYDKYINNMKNIKNISIFFNNNLSINEKIIFKTIGYIAPKRYYWFFNNTIDVYIYINFFILYYNIIEYDEFVEKLNIYVESNDIISIEIPFKYQNIKHYIISKNNNKYEFILKPDNILDDSLELINLSLKYIL